MMTARPWLALGVALAVAAGLPIAAAVAAQDDQPASAADAAKRTTPPSQARETLDRGIAAYKKNALASAVGAFSQALSLGGLDTAATARALYYRGLAYRKQGRSALAISDLNNALFLPNGLTEAERADALAARADAYKVAGIPDPGTPTAVSAPAPAKPAAPVDTAAAEAVAAKAPASGSFATSVKPAAPPAATKQAESAPPAASTPGSSSPIGSFFSNLFSGGSQSSPAKEAASDVTTASTGAPSAVSAWNSATEVEAKRGKPAPAAVATPASKQTAALAPAPSSATDVAATPPAKGKFKLQVAAVRSRAEAEKLAQRFVTEHGARAGGRTPAIEEAVFGNMGTFYRVNVGPFASQTEPDQLCKTMRGSGYDCLVVTH